jgi:hypothetical protein
VAVADFLHKATGTDGVSFPWWARALAVLVVLAYLVRRWQEYGYPGLSALLGRPVGVRGKKGGRGGGD